MTLDPLAGSVMQRLHVRAGGTCQQGGNRRTIPSGLWIIVALWVLVATAGCAASFAYLRLPHDERQHFEAYSAFMSTSQEGTYLSHPSPEARTAYAESLGLPQRLAALSEEEREAVFEAELLRGMSADALLMSWGRPYRTVGLGEDEEEWEYLSEFSRHLPPGVAYSVYMQAGRVYEWEHYVISAPESGGRP